MLKQISLRVRAAVRLLWREPGFAAQAVAILALGIGATTAVYSLIQGALLTPPPYANPQQLVLISARSAEGGGPFTSDTWSTAQLDEWRGSVKSLASVAAYSWTFNFLVMQDGSESEEGLIVSPEYFGVLGVEPLLGRAFNDSDAAGTDNPGIILGYDLWQRQFKGDAGIVGQTVRMSRMAPVTVLGVMPAGIRFLPVPGVASEPNYDVNAKVDFWLPMSRNVPEAQRTFRRWNVIARLANGATPNDAQAELAVVTARQAETTQAFAGATARVETLTGVLMVAGGRILLPLLAAAALVLLISCSNAAALLLVRGLQRQHEYGVRSAIGAGRVALFRHVIGESLSLALVGGVLGVALALATVALFKSLAGGAIPRLDAVSIGWPVVAFALGAALLACVLAGIFPAWLASKLDPVQALRNTAKSTASVSQRQVLGGVLVFQMALTMALLVGAGLLARTMYNLSAVQSGFDASKVLTMTVTSVEGNWFDFHERALERVAALPGVDKAAFAWGVPLTGNSWGSQFEIEGYTPPNNSGNRRVSLNLRAVTPGYFSLLGQRIEEGRDLQSTDRLPPPDPANPNARPDMSKVALVAIVNRAFVDEYFGGGSAIGKELRTQQGPTVAAVKVVGVVSNTRVDDLSRAPEPQIYMSLLQNPAFSKHLVVRTSGAPSAVVGAVQRELKAINPTVAVENVETLEDIRTDSLGSRTFAMQLLIGFATVAVLLTLAGVYGVLSLTVAARRRELAIRSAVGADGRRIVGLVLRGGLGLIGAGVVAGLVVSLALSRVLQAMLFDVGPADPATLGAAALAFIVVALIACALPALRAARVDPAESLKAE